MDKIIFSGAYKDWNYSVKFDVTNASSMDISYILSSIHKQIENRAFCYSSINCEKIEKSILEGNGIENVIRYLESKKPGEWKKFFSDAIDKKELIPVAETKFICALLSKNEIFATMHPQMINSPINSLSQELLENEIAFIAKYKDWIAIKKMSISNETKDYEVAGILSNINTTLVRKAFDFMNPNREMEKLAVTATRWKRKSFANLANALRQISSSLSGNKINDAYLLKHVFENLGFAPYANVDMLIQAYPDLKPIKPRGRIAKG